ncbi:MAG: phosphopantetheine-binding protein [Nostocaceae cyanobacterium]|nr:phosphopantetheine-binding protein [Nostocaceae cyanobacterium]
MKNDDEKYEIYILEKAINMYLDKTVPFTEEGLKLLVDKHDDCVWDIATKIYSKSGYKVGFSVVSDAINNKIEILKNHIAREKEKEAQRIAREREEEDRRIAKEREEEDRRIAKEREEEDRRIAKAKEEEARRIEQENQQRLEKENYRKNLLIELPRIIELAKNGGDNTISELFLKIQYIVSEQLNVYKDDVTLESNISKDLGADYYETIEVAMALEEEFEIEIPDDILVLEESVIFYHPLRSTFSNSFGQREFVACTVGELLYFIYNQLYS